MKLIFGTLKNNKNFVKSNSYKLIKTSYVFLI